MFDKDAMNLNPRPDGLLENNAGSVMVTAPNTPTTQLHLNPSVIAEGLPGNDWQALAVKHAPLTTAKQAATMLDYVPENTPFSSNSNAMTAAQFVQGLPPWQQRMYMLTGQFVKPRIKFDPEGYSTDIPGAMDNYA